ncbi:MAG: hypothetical protein OHK0045_05120 [Raineya sp.]
MLLNLTDIIFENRNKVYGAYRLRKNYIYALSVGLCCTIPLLLACIIWIKFEQKKTSAPTQETYLEREVMLQVEEEIDIVDISDLPVLVESNLMEFSQKKEKETSQENSTEENKNPEIKITEQPENEVSLKENPQEPKPQKDTANTDSVASSDKPSVVYSPDVWSIYVKQNLQYPTQALRDKKECNVFVAVFIKEDGSLDLDKERALYSCEDYFNEEVKRLIANAPRFIPATDAEGKPKRRINLKISFKLPEK